MSIKKLFLLSLGLLAINCMSTVHADVKFVYPDLGQPTLANGIPNWNDEKLAAGLEELYRIFRGFSVARNELRPDPKFVAVRPYVASMSIASAINTFLADLKNKKINIDREHLGSLVQFIEEFEGTRVISVQSSTEFLHTIDQIFQKHFGETLSEWMRNNRHKR